MLAEHAVDVGDSVPLAPALSFSAVVCASAGGRWSDTASAVQSLVDQTPRPAEVLVVIDHDTELAKRARAKLKHRSVRILENTGTPGPSGSRNTAIAEATGDVVAFLDQETTARPGWFAALVDHYGRPEVVAVGGHVEPRWAEGAGPVGLPPELLWVVGCSDSGRSGPRARPVRNLLASGMSFRRRDLAAVGGFDEALRRSGITTPGSEETELCIRLVRAVGRSSVVFEPSAVVDHRLTHDPARWDSLIRRCWAEGVSKAILARRVGRGDGLSVERSYLRVLPGAWRREMRAAVGAALLREGRAVYRSLARACALVVAVLTVCAGYGRGRILRGRVPSAGVSPARGIARGRTPARG